MIHGIYIYKKTCTATGLKINFSKYPMNKRAYELILYHMSFYVFLTYNAYSYNVCPYMNVLLTCLYFVFYFILHFIFTHFSD
jgi:hypothetical protein